MYSLIQYATANYYFACVYIIQIETCEAISSIIVAQLGGCLLYTSDAADD